VGISGLAGAGDCPDGADLLDPGARQRALSERAADRIREKFGTDAIVKGRSLR